MAVHTLGKSKSTWRSSGEYFGKGIPISTACLLFLDSREMVKVLLVTDDGRYLEGKRGRNNIKSHVNKFLFENELMEMEMKGTPLVFKKKKEN